MVNYALARLLLKSRGRKAPEGECNKKRRHIYTLLLYTLSIKDVGQDLEMMPLRSDRFGLAYDSSPFHLVFHYLLPVGHPYQVPADHVNTLQ